MRCPKCGYNSFDYLSECRKCSADLTLTRHELGFTGGKPATPFLLGPLLKEHKEAEPEAKKPAEGDAFEDLQHVSLDLPEEDLALSPDKAEESGEDAGGIGFFDRAQTQPAKTTKSSAQPVEDEGISFDFSGEQADWSFLDEQVDEDLLSQPKQEEEVEKPSFNADSQKKSPK